MISMRVGFQFDHYRHILVWTVGRAKVREHLLSLFSVSPRLCGGLCPVHMIQNLLVLFVAMNIHGNPRDAISRAGGAVESVAPTPPCACGEIARADNQTPA